MMNSIHKQLEEMQHLIETMDELNNCGDDVKKEMDATILLLKAKMNVVKGSFANTMK